MIITPHSRDTSRKDKKLKVDISNDICEVAKGLSLISDALNTEANYRLHLCRTGTLLQASFVSGGTLLQASFVSDGTLLQASFVSDGTQRNFRGIIFASS
jgi:hypothetical protein